jgi:predicted HicB family RNase H-like nuclease
MSRKYKFEPVMIRMPSDLHTAIKEKARAEERSMAGTIRHALREYVGMGITTTVPTEEPSA